MRELILFDAPDLLPPEWRAWEGKGPVRAFNPALLRDGAGWIFAYRAVGPDGRRRIGLCRLDAGLRVVAGSARALSDEIAAGAGEGLPAAAAARDWFADPRLYRLGGRIFLHWNSGWHEPRNYQFLQELDPAGLRPRGAPRELTLAGERRPLEKNWMIFGDGPFFAVYSVNPHRILRLSLEGEGAIAGTEIGTGEPRPGAGSPFAEYERQFGELRGGAPPQRVGGDYYSFCHSVYGVPENYRYVAAAYRFSASPPFAPTGAPAGTFPLVNPFGGERTREKLNPAVGEVTYPCGAALVDGRWFVSYGINDERCAIAVMAHAGVEAAVSALASGA